MARSTGKDSPRVQCALLIAGVQALRLVLYNVQGLVHQHESAVGGVRLCGNGYN